MLRNRPLAFFCLLFVTGSTLALVLPEAVFPIAVSVLAIILLYIFIARLIKKFSLSFVIITAALCAGLAYSFIYNYFIFENASAAQTEGFSVEVREICVSSNGPYADCVAKDGAYAGKRVRLYDVSTQTRINDVLTILPKSIQKADIWLLSNSVQYACTGEITYQEHNAAKGIIPSLLKIKLYVIDAFDSVFIEERNGAFASALLVGDKSALPEKAYSDFNRCGTSHVLAISGMHYSIIVMSFYSLLTFISIKKKTRCAICIISALMYTVIAGVTPATLRAAVMCIFVFSSMLSLKKNDSVSSMLAALLIACLMNPYSIFGLDTMLTFISCFTLIAVTPYIDNITRNMRCKRAIVLFALPSVLTIAITIFSMPITLMSMDYFSLIAPLANIIVALLLAPLMTVLSAIALLACIYVPTALVFIADIIIDALYSSMAFLAGIKSTCFSVNIPGISIAAVLSALVIAAALLLKQRVRAIAIAFLCTLTVLAAGVSVGAFSLSMNNKTYIACVDSGESVQLLAADGMETVYIDISGSVTPDNILYKSGFTEITAYVCSGNDDTSYIKIMHAIKSFNIDMVYLKKPYNDAQKKIYSSISDKAFEYGTKITQYDTSAVICIGNTTVSVTAASSVPLAYASVIDIRTNEQCFSYYGKTMKLDYNANKAVDIIYIPKSYYKNPYDIDSLPQSNKELVLSVNNKYINEYASRRAYAEITYMFGDGIKAELHKNGKTEVKELEY